MSVTIINADVHITALTQLLLLVTKNPSKKIYVSRKVLDMLIYECNEKRKKDECTTSIRFYNEEKNCNHEISITEVHNRILEHEFGRLDLVREDRSETTRDIFNILENSVLNSDDHLFIAIENEDIGDYAKNYDRHNISEFIDT